MAVAEELSRAVRARAHGRCQYCLMHEALQATCLHQIRRPGEMETGQKSAPDSYPSIFKNEYFTYSQHAFGSLHFQGSSARFNKLIRSNSQSLSITAVFSIIKYFIVK